MNTFPGLVHTARHIGEPFVPEVAVLTARKQVPKVWMVIGMKS